MIDEKQALVPIQKETQEALKTGHTTLQVIKAFTVYNQDTCTAAAQGDTILRQQIKELEQKRDSWCQPLNRVSRSISAEFKKAIDPRKEAREILQLKVANYIDQQRAEQVELLAEAQSPEEITAAVEVLAPLPAQIVEQVVYRGEVTDKTKVPREFWMINQKRLDAYIKSKKGDVAIPGVRIIRETKVRGK